MSKSMIMAALVCVASTAHAAELVQRANAIPGRYIVVLGDGNPAEAEGMGAMARIARRIGTASELTARHGARTEFVYQNALNGFVANMSERQARSMLRDPRVRFIEQDAVVRVNQTTQANSTWGLDRVDQRDLPINSIYSYFRTGRGVNAYIIDTGILDTHTEFSGRVGSGFSSIDDGRGTTDCNGHGTHVAGTVGGTTWGVAKSVTVHPVRVFDCTGSGSNSNVIAGIDWVTENHRKPAVANLSLGGGASAALDEAVRRSIAAGVTYAIAAGNDNANACTASPSRVTQGIVVGASTSADARAPFSNHGTCIDLFAPGQGIRSAWHTGNTAAATLTGTSMAAPHVTGAAALLLEETPEATPEQIQQALIASATPNRLMSIGSGSPNRLLFALDNGVKQDPAPTAAFSASCNGRTCTFDAARSSDNTRIVSYAWDFGDGTLASGPTVSKTYGSDGTFTVVLAIIDSANQPDTETAAITVAAPGPGAPCTTCTRLSETLERRGMTDLQPRQGFTLEAAGQLRGWLQGPSTADFDLYLSRWNGSSWQTVARSEGRTATETITFNATPGLYQWRIFAFKRSGNYTFWMQRP